MDILHGPLGIMGRALGFSGEGLGLTGEALGITGGSLGFTEEALGVSGRSLAFTREALDVQHEWGEMTWGTKGLYFRESMPFR